MILQQTIPTTYNYIFLYFHKILFIVAVGNMLLRECTSSNNEFLGNGQTKNVSKILKLCDDKFLGRFTLRQKAEICKKKMILQFTFYILHFTFYILHFTFSKCQIISFFFH